MPRGRGRGGGSFRETPPPSPSAMPPRTDRSALKRRARPEKFTVEGPVINLDDSDDDVAVIQVEKPPPSSTPKRGRGRGTMNVQLTPRPRPTQLMRPGGELFMECEEEALSPWQLKANKKAAEEYDRACKEIALAQAEAAAAARAPVPAYQAPVTPTRKGRGRGAGQASPDFIVLDEDSGRTRAGKGRGRASPVAVGQPYIAQSGPDTGTNYQIIGTSPNGVPIFARPMPGGGWAPVGSKIPVQRVPAQPREQELRAQGIKRGYGDDLVEPPAKKQGKGRPGRKSEEPQGNNWVPLDEYYYGKKEGDPVYREEKGEYRFKCWYCHKMLYNNVRIMTHMQGHIDNEKQQNLDLSDLTQCKHCYKQLDTPFEMQQHIEKVHQNKSNVLVCRICEKDHDNQTTLRQHMKQYHQPCEMPYICQLCNFRSSIYNDVVDHFKKRHDSSQFVLCLYCLKVFKLKSNKADGWGMTNTYFQHLQKHQAKQNNKKCSNCKLMFFNKADVKLHKSKDHLANYKGTLGTRSSTTVDLQEKQVMIKLPEASGKNVKSLNAPTINKVLELRGLRMYGLTSIHHCYECKQPMRGADHFKKYKMCSMCRFATSCNNAYSSHMMGFHSRNLKIRAQSTIRERCLAEYMYCLCGFKSNKGNVIANHLISCSKRTCYNSRRQARWFEYDDEQEDFNPLEQDDDDADCFDDPELSPERDVPSLFGALGLVKRASHSRLDAFAKEEKKEILPPTSEEVAQGIVDEILDNIFPAEAAASDALDVILSGIGDHIARKEEEESKRFDPFKNTFNLLGDDANSKDSGSGGDIWGSLGKKDDDDTDNFFQSIAKKIQEDNRAGSDSEDNMWPISAPDLPAGLTGSTSTKGENKVDRDDKVMDDKETDSTKVEDRGISPEEGADSLDSAAKEAPLDTESSREGLSEAERVAESGNSEIKQEIEDSQDGNKENPEEKMEFHTNAPEETNNSEDRKEEDMETSQDATSANDSLQEEGSSGERDQVHEPSLDNQENDEDSSAEASEAVAAPDGNNEQQGENEETEAESSLNAPGILPPLLDDEDSQPEAAQSLPEEPEDEQPAAAREDLASQAEEDQNDAEGEAAPEAEAAPESESQPEAEGGSMPEDEGNDSTPEDEAGRHVSTPVMDERPYDDGEDSPPEAEAGESQPEADGGLAAEEPEQPDVEEAIREQDPEDERREEAHSEQPESYEEQNYGDSPEPPATEPEQPESAAQPEDEMEAQPQDEAEDTTEHPPDSDTQGGDENKSAAEETAQDDGDGDRSAMSAAEETPADEATEQFPEEEEPAAEQTSADDQAFTEQSTADNLPSTEESPAEDGQTQEEIPPIQQLPLGQPSSIEADRTSPPPTPAQPEVQAPKSPVQRPTTSENRPAPAQHHSRDESRHQSSSSSSSDRYRDDRYQRDRSHHSSSHDRHGSHDRNRGYRDNRSDGHGHHDRWRHDNRRDYNRDYHQDRYQQGGRDYHHNQRQDYRHNHHNNRGGGGGGGWRGGPRGGHRGGHKGGGGYYY